MLKHVDVFLGVALVMLGVSLLITTLTQTWSWLLQLRGGALRDGLAELVMTLPNGLGGRTVANVRGKVEELLKHPLVAGRADSRGLVSAISRDDLVKLLGREDLLKIVFPEAADTEIVTKLRFLATDVDIWFDATMSRVAHRFARHTKVVTICLSVGVAFGFQLDAIDLVKRLYADSDLRGSLAGATTAMLSQADAVLATPALQKDVSATLVREVAGVLPPPPTVMVTREQAESWIRSSAPTDQVGKLLNRYDALLADSFKAGLSPLLHQASAIKTEMETAGFRLLPDRYLPYRPVPMDAKGLWSFLGVVTSVVLLSLGAPFWFNALKTASNLRPAMAAQVEARESTLAAQGDGGGHRSRNQDQRTAKS